MSIIYNGVSGLTAATTALNTTSSNIANAGVPGYSRQVANFTSAETGGVYISQIERISNSYAVQELWDAASLYGYGTTSASHAKRLEGTVSGEATGLSPSLDEYFGNLNRSSADPMDVAYRQEVLSSSNNLAARYNSLSQSFETQASDIQHQMEALVGETNGLLEQIASTNKAIAEASNMGEVPGHLLDQRDKAVQQLSEQLDIQVLIEGDQTATVTMPSGEPLVTRAETSEMTLVPGYPVALNQMMAVDTGTAVKRVDEPGGAIGGLIDFRDETLAQSQRELDRLALVLSEQTNQQLTDGFDLNGNPGEALFSDINSTEAMRNRSSHIGGANSVTLEVEISDTSALTADDYIFSKNSAGELTVARQPDGESVSFTNNVDGSVSFEGITISADGLPDFSIMGGGDTFLIQPGKNAAADMEVILTDPEKLAFSSAADEPGNNENLLELINIQDAKLVEGSSISSSWNSIVSKVASESASAQNSYTASSMIYTEAANKVMSESGVNLDEEAANMLVFQQLYSANAKVISAANQMFNTVLNMV